MTSIEIEALRAATSRANVVRQPHGFRRRRLFAPGASPRCEEGGLLMRQVLDRLGPGWHVTRYRTQNRRTLCARVSDGTRNAIAKIRLETDGQHDMEKEFEALSRAHIACGGRSGVTIPVPIAFHPELHALVMSEIPGVSLECTLQRRWKSRASVLSATGVALADFHAQTGCVEKVAGQLWHENTLPPAIRAACETRAEHAWGERVLDAYLATAERTRSDPVPFGFTHEDLAPQNVLVERFAIGFIDFENAQETHCLNDLARIALSTQFLQGINRPWRRQDRFGFGFDAQVLNTLCDGYGLTARHEVHFASILLRACLQSWRRAKLRQERRRGYRAIRDVSGKLAERVAAGLA